MENNKTPKANNDIETTVVTTEIIEKMVTRIFSGRKIRTRFRPQDSFYDSDSAIEIDNPVQVVFFPDQTGMIKNSSEIRAGGIVLIDDERRVDFTLFLYTDWRAKDCAPGVMAGGTGVLPKPSNINLITSKGKLTDTVFTLDLFANNTNGLPATFGQGRGFLKFDWERY